MSLLLALMRLVPEGPLRALFRGIAALAFALGIRRRVALENLAIAFPEKSEAERFELARANYRHLGDCAAEFLHSPALSDEELFGRIDFPNFDDLQRMIGETGLIACTAHMGNFELFGVYAGRRGVKLTLLTRNLKGSANQGWMGTRTSSGVRQVHKGVNELVRRVRGREGVAILIDQNMLAKRAIFVPFLGKIAATTPAPAVLAERTGAPVVMSLLIRKPDGRYLVAWEGPFHFERTDAGRQVDIERFTAMINARFEPYVRAHPEQWFWVHRRFKTRPPEERAASAAPPQVNP